MEKIRWIDCVKNEVVLLHRAKEKRDVQRGIKKRTANWTGCFLRRNCVLQYVIKRQTEDKVEGKIRGRKRRCKQLLYELLEKRRF